MLLKYGHMGYKNPNGITVNAREQDFTNTCFMRLADHSIILAAVLK
jgi:hypothetical protein